MHWIVWALLAPTVLMAIGRLTTGCGQRVYVVGAGPLAEVREGDAPEGTFYDLDVHAREPVDATSERIERALTEWPDVIVVGFDVRSLEGGEAAEVTLEAAYARVTDRAENTGAVPIVVAPMAPPDASPALRDATSRARAHFQGRVCAEEGLRICLDLPSADPPAIRAAVAAAVEEGLRVHETLPDVGH